MGTPNSKTSDFGITEEEIYAQACEVLPGGISRNTVFRKPHPNYASSASGCNITDIYGVKRIDFANNMASLIHGHAHPAIVEAAIEQIRNGTAYTLATQAEIRLARLLCDRVPSFEKIRFVNSGTEAVMAMIKAARAYTGRPRIAKAEGAYHGTYDFVEVSQLANPSNWGDINSPEKVPLVSGTPRGVLDDVIIFPFNDTERTISILNRYAGEIACVIIDPVPHRVGLIKANKEYIEAIHSWAHKNGALLVFDEVISFRTNYEGAQQDYQVKPDITALGKIIGGGFPVGAIAGTSEVMKVLDPREPELRFPLSGTFSANPVSMTAGRVAMEMFDFEAVQKLNALTQTAISQINQAIRIADVPVSLTGSGSMFKIHLKATQPVTYREAYEAKELNKLSAMLINHLYNENIIVTNSCSCMFSTALGQKEIDILAEALLSGFRLIKPELEKLQK
jgi:glutamate-1-semialdehyde 2,1-aminomutase